MKKMQWFAAILALALGAASSTSALAGCNARVGAPAIVDTSMLVVAPTSMDVTVESGHRLVTTLGTIANPSRDCFQNVVLELQYFDAAKNHVDTVTEAVDGLVVPAGDTAQFRVRESAARDATAYVSQSVRVVDAGVRWTKEPPSGQSVIDLLVPWLPMLLLIGVWIYFMRRYSSGKSLQGRMFAVMEQQLEVARAQSLAIQKAAAALERRAAGDDAPR